VGYGTGNLSKIPHLTPPLSAPEGREGDFELPTYCLQHAPEVFCHVHIPKTEYPVAVSSYFLASLLVSIGPKGMLSTVQLNSEPCCRTCEIDNVSSNWMLAAEAMG